MPIIKQQNQDFIVYDDHIELSKQYLEKIKTSFKKITGTRLSSILGFNKYSSEFKTWMIMTNIYRDVIDPTLSHVGQVIEPKIREYVEKKLNIKYRWYDPKKINFDVFSDNNFFGGIPDGEPLNDKNEIDYGINPMLEIKTTSKDSFNFRFEKNNLVMIKNSDNTPSIKELNGKYKTWFLEGKIQVPIDYLAQLGLYMYLRKVSKGLFAIGFLETSDYADPKKFDPNIREIHLVDFDLNLAKFQEYIDYALDWYKKYVLLGKSPKMTNEDKTWLQKELSLT